jgi:hypothetical protein
MKNADSEHSDKMTDIENDIKKELEKQTTCQLVYLSTRLLEKKWPPFRVTILSE